VILQKSVIKMKPISNLLLLNFNYVFCCFSIPRLLLHVQHSSFSPLNLRRCFYLLLYLHDYNYWNLNFRTAAIRLYT